MSKRRGGKGGVAGRVIRNLLVLALVFGVLAPVGLTLFYRVVPPPITYLMVQRVFEGQGLDHRWRSLDSMAPAMARAVVASEDQNFCSHRGFDLAAIQKAMAFNQDSDRMRGGSTISQQTAKNVFLWPQRSWLRKGLEAYFTVLIETLWGKKRIMEVYLNSIEMGPGVYGAESAARRYFRIGADRLTGGQAARIAAVLPSPLRYKVVSPGPYVARRTRAIAGAAAAVRRDGLAACVLS